MIPLNHFFLFFCNSLLIRSSPSFLSRNFSNSFLFFFDRLFHHFQILIQIPRVQYFFSFKNHQLYSTPLYHLFSNVFSKVNTISSNCSDSKYLLKEPYLPRFILLRKKSLTYSSLHLYNSRFLLYFLKHFHPRPSSVKQSLIPNPVFFLHFNRMSSMYKC